MTPCSMITFQWSRHCWTWNHTIIYCKHLQKRNTSLSIRQSVVDAASVGLYFVLDYVINSGVNARSPFCEFQLHLKYYYPYTSCFSQMSHLKWFWQPGDNMCIFDLFCQSRFQAVYMHHKGACSFLSMLIICKWLHSCSPLNWTHQVFRWYNCNRSLKRQWQVCLPWGNSMDRSLVCARYPGAEHLQNCRDVYWLSQRPTTAPVPVY